MGSPGGQFQSHNSPQRGLHPPFPDQAKSDKVTHHHNLQCKSPQAPLSDGSIAYTCDQKCSRTGHNLDICRVLQQAVPGSQTQQLVETYTGPQCLEQIFKTGSFKMETPETIKTSLHAGEWVTSIDFRRILHIPIQSHSRKYIWFHVQGQSYHFKALPFGLPTAPIEFTVVAKEVKLIAFDCRL